MYDVLMSGTLLGFDWGNHFSDGAISFIWWCCVACFRVMFCRGLHRRSVVWCGYLSAIRRQLVSWLGILCTLLMFNIANGVCRAFIIQKQHQMNVTANTQVHTLPRSNAVNINALLIDGLHCARAIRMSLVLKMSFGTHTMSDQLNINTRYE